MGKYPQNRFRRLVIVNRAENKPRQPSAGPRWWGQGRRPGINQAVRTTPATQGQSKFIRMAVRPMLSRGLWLEVWNRTWNFLRGYFVTGAERKRGAVILSFRRRGEFVPGKKGNGSVRWKSGREVAPQEGGRG